MNHLETREQLELAALEPGGLDRLTAGDTSIAAAVAGHLAGCPACADELERLRRSEAVVRDVIRTTPPADLRERTLAYVRAVGVERAGRTSAAGATAPAPARVPADRAAVTRIARRPTFAAAGLAATVLVSVVATGLVVGVVAQRALGDRDATIAQQADTVDALATVTSWSLRVGSAADARSVRLASTSGGPTSGTLVFSPSSGELVVVADELAEPPPGSEFRCWVEIDGTRRPVGKMFFGGGLSYWVGDVEAIAGLTGEAIFGVSLVEIGGGSGAEPVLLGEL